MSKEKENAKVSIAKKKKQKKILCYISLVVLNILLFLPLICRLTFKEKTEPEEKKEIVIINCNKTDESISSTFLNGTPQNILYIIKGDHTVAINADESEYGDETTDVDTSTSEVIVEPVPSDDVSNSSGNNEIIRSDNLGETIRKISSVTYDEEKNETSFRVQGTDMTLFEGYSETLMTIETQEVFFGSFGFTCTKSTLE